MTPIYHAPNLLQAHLVQGLLRSEGIEAQIEGGYLVGAIGELPAMGLIRVLVEPAAAVRALALINDMERLESDDGDEHVHFEL